MAGPGRRWRWLALVLLCAGSCSERVDNVKPVGGEEASLAEQQRLVRRLYLDLTGKVPDDAQASAALATLAEGNSSAARQKIAHELIGQRAFGDNLATELENRVFAGETLQARYGLICGIARTGEPDCNACGPPAGGDACSNCTCASIAALRSERASLLAAGADLEAGAPTGEIERRFGSALVVRRSFGDGALLTSSLFQTFLGRAAGPDEQRNGASIARGALLDPAQPAGVLFHRHGSSFADLADILFSSESYRESVVERVFVRYLGRSATPAERAHFAARLDDAAPDARPVIEAVVSSREYFAQ